MGKKTFAWLALFALAVAFLIIGTKGGVGVKDSKTALAEPVYPEKIDVDDLDVWLAYWEENQLSEEFLQRQNDFACKTAIDLFEKSGENALYSPVSLYYALSLAASGTAGETAKELCDFLEVENQEGNAADAGKLYRGLYADDTIEKLKISTSLWQDKTFTLKPEFLSRAAKDFYSSVYQVDFKDEKTAASMGAWVAEQTNGTITPGISPAPEQVLGILNTVYYYDEWQDQFMQSETKKDSFYLEDGSIVTVDFMNRKFGSHGFERGKNYTRSELFLKGRGSMVFVLPDADISLKELTGSASALREALEGGERMMGEVTFKLPKFAMDSSFDIRELMERMGVTKLFSGGDFSVMTDQKDIAVNAINQNTHISINENGVEASAFTQIQYVGAALPTGTADMFLDRPFLYGIKANGVWLFLGVCYNP